MSRLIAQLSVAYLRLKRRESEKIQPCAPNLLLVRPLHFQGNMCLLPPCLPHWPIVDGYLLMNNGRAEEPIKQGSSSPQKREKNNLFHNQRLKNHKCRIQSSTPRRVTAPLLPSPRPLTPNQSEYHSSQANPLKGAFILFSLCAFT